MTALDFYQQKLSDLDQIIEQHERRIANLQYARGLTAIPGLLLIAYGIFGAQAPRGAWLCGLVLIIVFLAIATWQEQVRWQLDWYRLSNVFYRRLVARCMRHWDELPPLHSESATESFRSALAEDLDLFGDRSLFRWFSLAATETGAKQIALWLSRWEAIEVISERQQAVQHLARARDWRVRFWDACHAFRSGESKLESIRKWTEHQGLYERYPWLKWACWIGPLGVMVSITVLLSAILNGRTNLGGLAFISLLIAIAFNLIITAGFIGKVHDVFVWIGGANRELQAFRDVMHCMEQIDGQEAFMIRIRDQLRTRDGSATDALRILQFRMRFAGLQRNPLFFIPYALLQILLLWDFHILEWMESWRSVYGISTSSWIESVAQVEVLASAATVADEHPDWSYPRWTHDRSSRIQIEQLGHPLLSESSRVLNDLSMEESRPLLLVTGSNMAGKSTLLRSLGVNIALSRTGSPAACRSWFAPNFDIASSIRVKDSLQDGVSFFMAELKRLKTVVDWAHENQVERGIPTLILLDEILQGTNSRERQIAVQSVLEHLTNLGCTVVASTHDLDLARIPYIDRTAQVVHFREFFESVDGQQRMRFDYKMRPGITPTTNALKLLELVGLPNGKTSS